MSRAQQMLKLVGVTSKEDKNASKNTADVLCKPAIKEQRREIPLDPRDRVKKRLQFWEHNKDKEFKDIVMNNIFFASSPPSSQKAVAVPVNSIENFVHFDNLTPLKTVSIPQLLSESLYRNHDVVEKNSKEIGLYGESEKRITVIENILLNPETENLDKNSSTVVIIPTKSQAEILNYEDKIVDPVMVCTNHNVELESLAREESENRKTVVDENLLGNTGTSIELPIVHQNPLDSIENSERHSRDLNIPTEINPLEIIDTLHKGRPKKGRKRKYPSQNRVIRKQKNIHNEVHYTQKGKKKEAKEFREYLCRCNCLAKVGKDVALEEFKKFYSMYSHACQRAIICSMVSELKIKRKRVKTSDKRQHTRVYKLKENTVCKSFFMNTLMISSNKINAALKSMKRSEGVKDCRGKAGGHNKLSKERLQKIITHIDKFPKYISHYGREKTTALYLRPDTTLPVMYKLYKEETTDPVSLSKYNNVFLTNFNLRWKRIKKDTCNTCDRYNILLQNQNSPDEINKATENKKIHLDLAAEARQNMKNDLTKAKTDSTLEVLCFDLQKTLPLPRIPTNLVFYKRQLWLYNCGIYSGKYNKSYCNCWLEGEAGRGAQEVGSCLLQHVMNDSNLSTIKELVLWSDSCGGQNRNIKIVLLMKALLEKHPSLTKITFKYLVPGHSFLPNDSDFGDIECALKHQQRLYTPDDYMNIMRTCRKKNPMIVKTIKQDDFHSSQGLEKSIVNRKVDVIGNKINWYTFREIEITKDKPLSMFIKTSYNDEKREIDFSQRRGRGKFKNNGKISFYNALSPLWPEGKPISIKKIADLKNLLIFIPQDAQTFYQNLKSDPNIREDIEGFNAELDFEIEEDT